MIFLKNRIEREQITIQKMIELYCKLSHKSVSLCKDCTEIYEYAMKRLEKCPFEDEKPTCINCPVHCYRETEKQKIREIMRFSGPRMLKHHPVLAIIHLIDNRKKVIQNKINNN
ncbi:MAG: nitrous oxide-stimulated promoter family protein [Bacteroidota bacterium]